MDHIDLARWGQALIVAPASADWMARTRHGLANDLLTTVQLAMEGGKPRLLCPAMNPTMLEAPAVQRNLDQLTQDGWQMIAPGKGHMACGEAGQGRMAEPQEIADHVLSWFA
jgi:phosphopantothenoylcysteine decarboxylase/phosphopantothenate--cysteine ligase